MTTRKIIEYIEKHHWVSCTDEEIEENKKYESIGKHEILYNIWIPYHDWQKLKEMIKNDYI